MLTLPLEPTDDRANPVFKDAASCAKWVSQFQLTNLQLAQSQLLTQINELNRYPMRGLERFNTLEILRETVAYVQHDFAKKLIDKPLPYNESELMIFLSIVQLWQAMVTAYQRCIQSCIAGEKTLANHTAILCQRALHYCGLEIIEYTRSGYEFHDKLWHQLHELYAYSEQRGFHQTEVPDPLNPDLRHTCVNSYVKTLLTCFSNPARMTRWQIQQMDRWLSVWVSSTPLSRCYALSKNDSKPLAVDLSGAKGLQRIETVVQHDAMRYLEIVPLSKLLRVKTILLRQGQTPLQVGLGDIRDTQACIEFITLLHQCWCEDEQARAYEQKPVAIHARVCCKPEIIYAHLSEKPFAPRDRNCGIDSLAVRQIATLGHARPQDKGVVADIGAMFPLENWQIKNESVMGACLIRIDADGERLKSRQLIALRGEKSRQFTLAATVWVKVTAIGQLQIGVRYFHGRSQAVSIGLPGKTPAKPDAPAILLEALPTIKTPASLIIPRDWFEAGRLIEVLQQDGQLILVKLGFSVELGLDYERVSFTAI
ncbi:MAG: hypothetical protein PHP85_10775 [Gallionella sp.]|nr:hypothetical protein [Gallionella sp.]